MQVREKKKKESEKDRQIQKVMEKLQKESLGQYVVGSKQTIKRKTKQREKHEKCMLYICNTSEGIL